MGFKLMDLTISLIAIVLFDCVIMFSKNNSELLISEYFPPFHYSVRFVNN